MSMEPPFFEEALRAAEAKIARVAGADAKISVEIALYEKLMDILELMDTHMFREELRYSRAEFKEKGDMSNFALLLCEVEKRPASFLFGYSDPKVEGGFYLDTLATLIEGKGIGSTLIALLMVYAWETGYNTLSLNTEENDEKGRPLRRFYEALGFRYLGTDPKEGDLMRIILSPEHVNAVFKKYILGQRSTMPPVNG